MADDLYSYNPDPLDGIADDENVKLGISGLMSPAPAQSLVLPPPNTPPKTGSSQTTPQTGTLAVPPQQAQPKVSGAPMIPGIATKPETLQRQMAQTQQAYNSAQPINPGMPSSIGATTSMPSLQDAAQPSIVPDKLNMRTQQDQDKLAQLQAQPSGGSQIQNRWGRILAKVGDVAGSVLAPNVTQYIPGSTLNHQRQLGIQQGIVSSDEDQQQKTAQLADTQQQTAQRQAQAAGLAPVMVTPEMHIENPSLVVGTQITPKAYGDTLKAQTTGNSRVQGINDRDIQQAASKGQKPVYGDPTNPQKVTGFEDDKDSAAYQSRTVQDSLREAQQDEASAKAELARAGNDPTSPYYKLALRKANTASANAAAAQVRANAYALNSNAGNLGVDNQGNAINGSYVIGGKPVGSRFGPQAAKGMGNIAKFQDVYSSIDNANAALDEADKTGAKFNSAGMAAALADPKTTASQWITGQVNTKLSPQEQNLVITTKALREQIQAMRASVGGGVSDSQVNRLVDQLPSATTPNMDYARKQLATVRQQLDRLQSGLPGVNNGPRLQAPGSPANPTNPGGVPPRIPRLPVGGNIPAQAAAQLREGTVHTFNNGQQWTLRNGKPVRVK